MKRTSLLAAAAGAAVVLGLAGTALAASGDSGKATVTFTAIPSPSATDDDGGLRGDGTVDDDGDDGGLRGDGTVDDNGDDGGLRGDGTVDDNGDDGGLRGDGTVDDDGPSASPSPSSTAPAAGNVSAATAGQIALRAAGGGRITKLEASSEHGRPIWDVRVMNGSVRHDIDVDRVTGQITRHKSDVKSSGGGSGGSDDKGGDDKSGHGGDDD